MRSSWNDSATKNAKLLIQGSWIWATSAAIKMGNAITAVFISNLITA